MYKRGSCPNIAWISISFGLVAASHHGSAYRERQACSWMARDKDAPVGSLIQETAQASCRVHVYLCGIEWQGFGVSSKRLFFFFALTPTKPDVVRQHVDCVYPRSLNDSMALPDDVFCVELPVKYGFPPPVTTLSTAGKFLQVCNLWVTDARLLLASLRDRRFDVTEVPDYEPTELQMAKMKMQWQGLLNDQRKLIDPRDIYERLQPGTLVLMECTFRVLVLRDKIVRSYLAERHKASRS